MYSDCAFSNSFCASANTCNCSGKFPSNPPFSIIFCWISFKASSKTLRSSIAMFLYSGDWRNCSSCARNFCNSCFATLSRFPKINSQLILSLNSSKSTAATASFPFSFKSFFSASVCAKAIFLVYSKATASLFSCQVPYCLLYSISASSVLSRYSLLIWYIFSANIFSAKSLCSSASVFTSSYWLCGMLSPCFRALSILSIVSRSCLSMSASCSSYSCFAKAFRLAIPSCMI